MPQRSENRVDLPAPFGPMMQRSSPAGTASVTRSVATTPPKRLARPSVARIGSAISAPRHAGGEGRAPAAPRQLARQRHDDAVREEQHREDQERPGDDQRVL